MQRLSASQFSSFRWSFFQDVIRFAGLGFESIGVWRHKIDEIGYETAAEMLDEMRMSVSSLSWAGGFTGSSGRSHRSAIEDSIDAIYQAHMIGARCLIIHPGARNGHTMRHSLRLLRSAIDEMLPIAADLGVRLAIEPVLTRDNPWNFLGKFKSQLEFVRNFEAEHVGLVLDLYHVGRHNEILENLASIRPYLALIQLADMGKRHADEENRCLLGQGKIPVTAWLNRLNEIDFDGFLEIEIHGFDLESIPYENALTHSRDFVQTASQKTRIAF